MVAFGTTKKKEQGGRQDAAVSALYASVMIGQPMTGRAPASRCTPLWWPGNNKKKEQGDRQVAAGTFLNSGILVGRSSQVPPDPRWSPLRDRHSRAC